ncbi:alpha/beta hydrolase [Rickettsiales bacterium]|nr:alpha/beta hydrolase [Rickettsiales bacterium]
MSEEIKKLHLSDDKFIAYHHIEGKENKPAILFLSGFMSDMNGLKATALEDFCRKKGYSYTRFDYFGHGQSSGEFNDGTIGQWKQNALDILDKVTKGPQILVGSSMGGWIALLIALQRADRIAGLVGIAAAPDFTESLIWEKLSPEDKKKIKSDGVIYQDCDYGDDPYPITMNLIEEGRNHLLLDKDKLDINVPVRLLHGALDQDVPYNYSVNIGELVTSDNMCVNIVFDGDHRMSEPKHIELICNTIDELIK